MQVGIGLPNAVPGATGRGLIEWARRADQAGFSSLGSIGAVSYPSYEELTVFAAAGAVTERIRFFTNVLIAPPRSAAELAKQAATVDQLTNGRLTLGLGVGWRESDFLLTGRDFDGRGAAFDEMLPALYRSWRGEALDPAARPASPPPVQSPIPVMIGGTTQAAIRRVVDHGAGWTAGGLPPDAVSEFATKVRTAWQAAGRDGEPYITALVYFGLGDTEQQSRESVLDYYKPMGDDVAQMIAGSVLRSAEAIQGAIQAYEATGAHELIFAPTVSAVDQVDLLANVVFG
ncbi:LLM class flavin-dependent oxidoreductase [Hoyosella sp. YIM 151337]|uniref:LLM class flavin-dependent oxidoreductase n=1 Tax=Hoyosella sp. YIM 151337 TaxID=2992742 RepID=UPI002235AAA1|nr:LLM class flavin-dependent oxidoreductase [Hoyosella sp. YIM 151337]MCW4354028.1 LLM class flavin-dependent oxidoreductase [Hoyosella sp. YIM 151337]